MIRNDSSCCNSFGGTRFLLHLMKVTFTIHCQRRRWRLRWLLRVEANNSINRRNLTIIYWLHKSSELRILLTITFLQQSREISYCPGRRRRWSVSACPSSPFVCSFVSDLASPPKAGVVPIRWRQSDDKAKSGRRRKCHGKVSRELIEHVRIGKLLLTCSIGRWLLERYN